MEIKKFDIVENPSHYFKGGMWCEKAIQAITSNLTGFEAVCVANIVKYLWPKNHITRIDWSPIRNAFFSERLNSVITTNIKYALRLILKHRS